MNLDMDEMRATFFEEADEHLGTIETTLLALEQSADDEAMNRLFRAAHSLKGASGSVGILGLMRFTHVLEDLLDRLRKHELQLTQELLALLLTSKDTLTTLVSNARSGDDSDAFTQPLVEQLKAAAVGGSSGAPEQAEQATDNIPSDSSPQSHTFEIRFAPNPEIFERGSDPLLVLRDLARTATQFDVTLDTSDLPALSVLEPEACHLSFDIRLTGPADAQQIKDAFAFVESVSEITINEVTSSANSVAESTAVTAQLTTEVEVAPAAPTTPVGTHPTAERPAGASPPPAAAPKSTIRVATEKIDRLMNLVGEIVIVQSMLADAANSNTATSKENLRNALDQLERHTRELQDRVMSIRMVPISTVFGRFPRILHDLARTCGKNIQLIVDGGDTEIDKGIVEQLADPLIHLLRNSVDHGIESPDQRIEVNKPPQGTVHLRAYHRSGNVVIEILDDGRGMQTEKIRQKATAQGLISEDKPLTDDEIHSLIFLPGFSTASVVTDISGRGVGMDVVKRNVAALGGTISLSSVAGQGSRFQISLPLTLAILDGLLLRVGDQLFVLPLASVVEAFSPQPHQITSIIGQGEIVRVRGESLTIVHIGDLLRTGTGAAQGAQALVCVVEAGNRRIALLVDEVIGQSQLVVKSLETNFRRVDGVMGATILGDGRIAFILDVHWFARASGSSHNTNFLTNRSLPSEENHAGIN